jgi:predicted pyridoxine 5'-phosphate oxidase superfamily flavin-nucleotide-binding protein
MTVLHPSAAGPSASPLPRPQQKLEGQGSMKVLNFPARGRLRNGRRHEDMSRPGSRGEHILQERYGTTDRATQFYCNQLSDRLTPRMVEFIGRMEMAFIATSDSGGECDCSFRAGTAGFLRVLDERTIAYPEFRGNGVMASLGNILENPHVGIFMADFSRDLIGLHVNGDAEIITPVHMQELDCDLPEQASHSGRRPVQWVLVRVTEAYIHCSKHIPLLIPQSRVRHWGSDNPRHKGADYFGAAAQKRAGLEPVPVPAVPPAAAAKVLAEAGAELPDGHTELPVKLAR